MTHADRPTRTDFERLLQTLVGRSITAVTYYEIDYGTGKPSWNQESPTFDSLDFGLELTLDDGSVFSFTWGSEFTCYNVSVVAGPLGLDTSTRCWDATERWAPLLGRPIEQVTSYWPLDFLDPDGVSYLQEVLVSFADAPPVLISAFESWNGTVTPGLIDHITIFFDDADMLRFRIGPYAPDA